MTAKTRILFVMRPALGWRTYARNLKCVVDGRDDIEAHWIEAPDHGWTRHFQRRTSQRGGRARLRVFDALSTNHLFAGRKLRSVVRQFNPHIIHGAGHYTGSYFGTGVSLSLVLDSTRRRQNEVLRAAGEKTVWTERDIAREDRLLAKAAFLWPMSRWAVDILPDSVVQGTSVTVIPPSVQIPLLDDVQTKKDDLTDIVMVGNPFDRKGGYRLLDWVTGPLRGKCRLNIVGSTAPLIDDPFVVNHGRVENDVLLSKLLPTMDLFCLPTMLDMSSWALVEAASAGLPGIISDLGGIPELVDHGHTGYCLPNTADADFLSTLDRLIASPRTLAQMSSAARSLAETRFSANRNYNEMLDSLVEHAKPNPA